jgi:hypothetical protein
MLSIIMLKKYGKICGEGGNMKSTGLFIHGIMFILLSFAAGISCGGGGGGDTPLRIFYVDAVSGDDVAHDGLSPEKAWRTLSKVNSYPFQPGDAIKFRRGGIFEGGIEADWSGTAENPIIIDAYGSGDLPVFLGSRVETGWSNVSGTIYSKSKTYTPGVTGAGIILEDGVPLEFRVWNIDAATSFGPDTGVFTYDPSSFNSSTLYIRCTDSGNPSAHTIEAGFDLFGIHGDGRSYIRINNIHFQNYSLHGVTMKNCSNIEVRNCIAENIGGAILSTSPVIYAGNGFEFTLNSSNCSVYDSTAKNIFDSGFSPQVFESNTTTRNVLFENCTAEKCGFAGFELSVLKYGTSSNESLENIRIVSCAVTGSGTGWSGIRYGSEGHGIRVKADTGAGDITGVSITRSTISDCEGAGIYIGGETGTVEISRTRISDNNDAGVMCEGIAGVSTLKLRMTSSLVLDHTYAPTTPGISYNVVDGNGIDLVNNTFYNNGYGLIFVNCGGTAVVKNNIFYSNAVTQWQMVNLDSDISCQSDYNCFYIAAGIQIGWKGTPYTDMPAFRTATNLDLNSPGLNPLFDTPGIDFHLQNSSPCKSTGTSAGVAVDYDGNLFGGSPSRGAFK